MTIENYGDEAYWGDFYLRSETGAYSVTLEGVKFGTDQYKKDLEEDGHINITLEPVAKDSNKRNRLDQTLSLKKGIVGLLRQCLKKKIR